MALLCAKEDVPGTLWLSNLSTNTFVNTSNSAERSIIARRARYYLGKAQETKIQNVWSELEQCDRLSQAHSIMSAGNVQAGPQHRALAFSAGPTATVRKCPAKQTDLMNRWRVGIGSRAEAESSCGLTNPRDRARFVGASPYSGGIPFHKGNSDPFNASPVALSALQYHILTTVNNIQTQQSWADELATPSARDALLGALQKLNETLLLNTVTTHAFFAYAWIAMANFQPSNRMEFARNAQLHELKAARALQPLLGTLHMTSDADIDVVVMAVLFISCAAGFRADYAASSQHQKGLATIVKAIGGLQRLPWIRRETIAYSSVTMAEAAHERCALHPQYWDPGAWAETFPSYNIGKTTTADSSRMSALSPQAQDILAQLRELITVTPLDRCSAVLTQSDLHAWFRWTKLRTLAIRGRTLNHWADLTERTGAVEPTPTVWPVAATVNHATLDMCMCLSIHLFTAFVVEKSIEFTTIKQAWHIMLMRCISKVGVGDLNSDPVHARAHDILFMYAVGVLAEDARPVQLLETDAWWRALPELADVPAWWFTARFGPLARSLGYSTYDQVARVFEQHYAHKAVLQDPVLRGLFSGPA